MGHGCRAGACVHPVCYARLSFSALLDLAWVSPFNRQPSFLKGAATLGNGIFDFIVVAVVNAFILFCFV